ncbi:MAG: hypothetical protein U0930_05645 [Pirellulales bacterium]
MQNNILVNGDNSASASTDHQDKSINLTLIRSIPYSIEHTPFAVDHGMIAKE